MSYTLKYERSGRGLDSGNPVGQAHSPASAAAVDLEGTVGEVLRSAAGEIDRLALAVARVGRHLTTGSMHRVAPERQALRDGDLRSGVHACSLSVNALDEQASWPGTEQLLHRQLVKAQLIDAGCHV